MPIGVEGKRHDPRRDRLTLGGKGGLIPRLLRVPFPAGPPIIRPGHPLIDFLPGVPPDIPDIRQVRGRMQAKAKGIPQPIGPDLGPNAIAPVIKRIHGQRRLGRTAIGFDAQNLPGIAIETLGPQGQHVGKVRRRAVPVTGKERPVREEAETSRPSAYNYPSGNSPPPRDTGYRGAHRACLRE